MCLSGLNKLHGTQFYQVRNPDTPDYVQAKYKVRMEGDNNQDSGNWVWRGGHSEIYSITGRMGDQAASGLSPNKVIMEEVGVWKNWIDTYRFIQPMLETEGWDQRRQFKDILFEDGWGEPNSLDATL